MKIAKRRTKHIFCLEADWFNDLRDRQSIESALTFLEKNSNIKYIHRHFSTKEEFFSRLHEYRKKIYFDYMIFYVAAHGFPSGIRIGNDEITLEEIAEKCNSNLEGKIIHFGSCSTLKLDKRYLNRFLKDTGALCISGFKKEIPFISATMFDILYFEMCQKFMDVRAIEKRMNKYYSNLLKNLDFRMVYL